MMRSPLCRLLFRLFGHRVCCHLPEWTAHVGRPWRPVGEEPWNLYNILWRMQQWVCMGLE